MALHTSTSRDAQPVIAHADTKEILETSGRQSHDSPDSPHDDNDRDPEKGELDDVKPTEHEKNECTCGFHPKSDLVDFDGPDDPDNPKNWPKWRKWLITSSMGWMTFVVTFSSSIFSVAVEPVAEEYGVSTVVATLGVALFLFGFVFGPVFFGPASEAFGRRIPLHFGYLLFAIFQIPVAVARNLETIMLGRFLSGFFAAAPLAVVGGALADIWDPLDRAYGVCAFAAGAFTGPVAGPILGGFVTQSYLGWRWTAWFTIILAALFGIIGLIVVPETSAAKILQMKAKRLRFETKNWALHAKADENQISLDTIVNVYLKRPWIMLAQEPILALVTAYMSFIYGIIYLLFEAYPISFHEQRGWNIGVASLPFCGFVVGIALGTGMIAYSTRTNFTRAYRKHGKVIPEERLPPMIVGAIILPLALFLFGWTSFPSITWVPQIIASALLGTGCLVTFWQGMNYIIDCYGFYSNSAIAVNTFIRSIAGGGFPLFAPYMYHRLGVPWATSLLAFLCLAFLPVPILFYKYGARIRAKSRFKPAG